MFNPSRSFVLTAQNSFALHLLQSHLSREACVDGVGRNTNGVSDGVYSECGRKDVSWTETIVEPSQTSSKSGVASDFELDQVKTESSIQPDVEPRVSAVQRRQQALARQKQSLVRGTSSEVV